jgi:hypothetical protein
MKQLTMIATIFLPLTFITGAICLPRIAHVAGSGNRLGALEKHGRVLRLGLDGIQRTCRRAP